MIGLGRELNIVALHSCYTYGDVPCFFHYRGPALSEIAGTEVTDPMVDMFVGDIENGIAGTEVKAGLLKCSIDHPGMQPGVERVMRAIAKAQHRTGAPITVHPHPGSKTGLEVERMLCDEEGVDPSGSCSATAATRRTWTT